MKERMDRNMVASCFCGCMCVCCGPIHNLFSHTHTKMSQNANIEMFKSLASLSVYITHSFCNIIIIFTLVHCVYFLFSFTE